MKFVVIATLVAMARAGEEADLWNDLVNSEDTPDDLHEDLKDVNFDESAQRKWIHSCALGV